MLKRKSKRVLSIVLAVAMIVGLFPIAAFADEGTSTSKTIYVNASATDPDGTNNTYTTLSAAVSAANDGDTIQLNSNVSLSASVDVDDTVTLDLNGKKIDAGTNEISLASGSELIIKDSSDGTGEISASGQKKEGTRLFLVDNATLTLNGGKFNAADNNYGVYASNGGKVIVNAGTFNAGYAPLAGNNTTGDTNFEVNGGTLTAKYGPAIYMPSQVNLTITNGTLNGGISLRMGQVNISGGTINATTNNIDAVENYYDFSGNAWLADALYVFNGTYTSENEEYGNSLDLNITGGTFNCTNNQGSAIAIYDLGKVAQSSDVSISGSAALHSNAEGRSAYQVLSLKDIGVDSPEEGFNNSEYVGKVQSSITGGTFSSDVSTYVPNGYICKQNAENKNWTVSGISSGQMVVKPGSSAEGNVEATLDGVYNDASTDIKDEVNSGESSEESNVDESGVVVNIAKNDAPATTSATLNVTKAAAKSLASAPALTVKTDVGDVQLDAQALDKVAQATDDVAITIEKKTTGDSSAKALYTVEVKSGDKNLLPESATDNGTVTITVEEPANVEDLQAWYVVGENSSLIYVERLAAAETDGRIAITINHLSSVALTDGNPKNQEVATVVDAGGNLTHHATLQDAVTAAENGGTITLVKNVEIADQISLPANATLDGAGHTLTYTGGRADSPTSQGFLNTINDNVTIKNVTIEAPYIKHAVQFYRTEGGTLDNVTINGAARTAVLVNGSTGINIVDCDLNPAATAYANIDFSMGSSVITVPSMTVNNVSFNYDKPAVWVDNATLNKVKGADSSMTNDEAIKAVTDKITYTSPTGGSLNIVFCLNENNSETTTVREESTYQPPYTGKYSYEIFTKVGENGTISVDRYATEGDDVTITVSPDEAYLLDELTVTANGKEVEVKDNGDGTYTFKMPSADAKIVVTFAEDPDWEPAPEMPFTDVNEGDWFYDVVLYAYENGLMTGTSADTFAPNQTTTRGMIVSMLARLEGVTSAEDAGFADVAANDWYATAVNWAASVGVVNGYEDNTFRPNAPITREQMAAILYNYADYKGYDVSARADLSDYADAADVSSWAEDVLSWANAEGLINGMTATTIDPQGATTRAQTAAMFERFLTAHEA